jgi:hypothetical protein
VIVRPIGERIQLITQPDHAHLARRIMEYCRPLSTRPRRDSILHAIAEHDNGWAEEDAAPSVNVATGQIFDFVTAPSSVRQSVWPRGVARLAGDPWAAALVAQHAITVYDRFRSDSDWTSFFSGMEASRDAMLRVSTLPLGGLLEDYAFVRLADLISLTFCTGWTDEQRFAAWTVQRSDTHVVVRPDVFAGAVIPIEINAREVPNQPYSSDAELLDTFSRSSATTLRGSVAATGSAPSP